MYVSIPRTPFFIDGCVPLWVFFDHPKEIFTISAGGDQALPVVRNVLLLISFLLFA